MAHSCCQQIDGGQEASMAGHMDISIGLPGKSSQLSGWSSDPAESKAEATMSFMAQKLHTIVSMNPIVYSVSPITSPQEETVQEHECQKAVTPGGFLETRYHKEVS